MQKTLNVAITGAAGQIAYSFIPQLLNGSVFGQAKIDLRLLDIEPSAKVMEGVIMQVRDGNYTLLQSVNAYTNADKAFENADVIVFLGGFPRKPGMQRRDLLQMNKKIFVNQAKSLSTANENVKCVVISNPANTNANILAKFAPEKIKKENITCLTRLDHNRAVSQIAEKIGVNNNDVQGVMIFGNHSLTQYPCIEHIKVKGVPIKEKVQQSWLKNTFIEKVQKRGGEVIAVRGGSSVFSAAKGVVDHLRDWYSGTGDKIVSMGVQSNGQYGVAKGVWSSFPVRCKNFKYEIVQGIELSQFCKDNIKITSQELVDEINLAGV